MTAARAHRPDDTQPIDDEDGRSRRARERRGHTRQMLLDTARSLFAEVGYYLVTPERIAVEAGVSRATFYQHFETKADAFAAVLDDLLGKLDAAVRGVSLDDGADPPAMQLLGNLHRVLDILLERRELTRLLLIEAVVMEEQGDRRVESFYDHVLQMIEASLVEGRDAGLVRAVDPKLVALCILGSVKEVLLRRFERGAPVAAEARDHAAREILAFNLLGVADASLRDVLEP